MAAGGRARNRTGRGGPGGAPALGRTGRCTARGSASTAGPPSRRPARGRRRVDRPCWSPPANAADLAVAARVGDVVLVTPRDATDAAGALDEVRAAESTVGRTGPRLRVVADIPVALDGARGTAALACSPTELADLLVSLWTEGLDGARLRPATLPGDLLAIVDGVVPALQRHGVFRTAYGAATLRARLGLGARTDQVGNGAPDTVAV